MVNVTLDPTMAGTTVSSVTVRSSQPTASTVQLGRCGDPRLNSSAGNSVTTSLQSGTSDQYVELDFTVNDVQIAELGVYAWLKLARLVGLQGGV